MLRDFITWTQGCFQRPDCTATVLVVATVVVAITSIVLVALAIAANRSSTRLRLETAAHARLAALPILEVIFHRAPDRIFLRNVSTASAASRAILQGFRFSWNRETWETWRCAFEPIGMLAPGREMHLNVDIDREPLDPTKERAIPSNQVFTTAFSRAVDAWSEPMVLALYFEDAMGSWYRSDVRVTWENLEDEHPEIRPDIIGTTSVERFPDIVEPLDRTREARRQT